MTQQELNKLGERKTVHEWLNKAGIPKEEMGKPICLLRRLRIAVDQLSLLNRYRRLLSGPEYAKESRETLIALAVETEKELLS